MENMDDQIISSVMQSTIAPEDDQRYAVFKKQQKE